MEIIDRDRYRKKIAEVKSSKTEKKERKKTRKGLRQYQRKNYREGAKGWRSTDARENWFA